ALPTITDADFCTQRPRPQGRDEMMAAIFHPAIPRSYQTMITRSYYWKRVSADAFGRRWELWEFRSTPYGWDDGRPLMFELSGGKTQPLRFWREISAARICTRISDAYNNGVSDQRERDRAAKSAPAHSTGQCDGGDKS